LKLFATSKLPIGACNTSDTRRKHVNVWMNVKPNRKLMAEFATLEPGEAFATALGVLAAIAVATDMPEDSMVEHLRNAIRVAAEPKPGSQ
jgi:hypothetical protein